MNNNGGVRIKISTKSARELWNGCTVDYITNVCHGRCCTTGKGEMHVAVLDDEIPRIEALGGKVVNNMLQPKPGGGCPFQQANGFCSLHASGEKPMTCWLLPFTLNDNDTLIVKNRNRRLACYKQPPYQPTYKAYKKALDVMFGEQEAARITQRLDAGGGDFYANMPWANYVKIRQIINITRASYGD